LGRASNGARRVINNNSAPLIPTSCIDEGSQLYIITPNDSQVITVTPGDDAVTCTVSNTGSGTSGGGGGGGGGGGAAPAPAPTTTAPTTKAPAQTVTVFKDGKLINVTPEEAAKLKAEEAAKAPVTVKPAAPSKEEAPKAPVAPSVTAPKVPAIDPALVAEARTQHVQQISQVEAPAIAQASTITEFAQNVGVTRNETKEENVITNIVPKVNIDFSGLLGGKAPAGGEKVSVSAAAFERAIGFIAYGTETTQIGEGERAGVLNSYIAAYGKTPATNAEWSDLLKIASGRFPTEQGTKTADRALVNFQRTYGRAPSAKNANDQAAMTIMQYGLLPVKATKDADGEVKIVPNRDTKKERDAIVVFRKKFGFDPKAATAWNVVRAIGYSGVAVR
jgi:hypothetical protein